MKISNLIIAFIVLAVLGSLAYFRLTAKVESSMVREDMPVDSKEFVWVRMDSLSRGLADISGTEIVVDSTKSKSYIIKYSSKQFLLHERVEGIETNREHLLSHSDGLMDYEEKDSGVEIKLKRKDNYVYCPALILDRILYWKNKKSSK